MKAVFASRNRHKAEQVRLLLPDVELVPLDAVAPDLELEEPFDTFEANALAKAEAVVRATGWAAVADDSGLEVDALGGAPGVLSARFAGAGATDRDNNDKLIAELEGVADEELTCRYRCVAVLVTPVGGQLVAHGVLQGRVVRTGRGTEGFGYDPHVVPEGESRTMGEIPLNEKLAFSHRGRAFRALAEKISLADASERAARLRVERTAGELNEAEVDPDPVKQFQKWLDAALASESGEPNAMALATATREGRPSARMVLLRGIDDRGFVFYTNFESRKGRELEENPQAAIVFYWGILQRQVCISGRVARMASEESKAYFDSRPRGHRLGAWASRQSQIIASRAEVEERMLTLEDSYRDSEIPLPPYWGGFRLAPDSIEFWQGRPNRLHDRLRYTRAADGSWMVERLSP